MVRNSGFFHSAAGIEITNDFNLCEQISCNGTRVSYYCSSIRIVLVLQALVCLIPSYLGLHS